MILDSSTACPSAATVPDLVARHNSDATALEVDGHAISYGELRRTTARLAQRLTHLGVGPGSILPLCSSPSPQATAGVLATWHVGAAYLPIDPNWPAARWRTVLSDTQSPLVLVESDLLPTAQRALAEIQHQTTVKLEALPDPAHRSPTPPDVAAPLHPDQLAYVIYTSGSTGSPKGVMVQHGSLHATITSLVERYQLVPADRLLQFAPMCFDVSVEEIAVSLVSGATLVDGTQAKGGSYHHFLAECRRLRISVLELPTAYWHALTDHLARTQERLPPEVRLVIVGGEPARPDVVASWNALRGPRPTLLNAYGLTETTITTHVGALDAPFDHATAVLVGAPLPGVSHRILDPAGRPVPHGRTGELFVGGTSVAQGYLRRPEETRRRFVTLPTATGPQRHVATGDLAREHVDRALEITGRTDEQIKLRGYRIEPGEVERALATHPQVRDVVVGLRDGGRSLTAWVATDEPTPNLAELQELTRRTLPDYMTPRELVQFPMFPLTSSGKVDRRAVKATAGPAATAPQPAPIGAVDGPVAAEVSGLWQQVLGADAAPGPEEDFLAAGGDSLQAMQLLARLRERFGVDLTMRQFLDAATPARLAVAVGAAAPSLTAETRPAAEPR